MAAVHVHKEKLKIITRSLQHMNPLEKMVRDMTCSCPCDVDCQLLEEISSNTSDTASCRIIVDVLVQRAALGPKHWRKVSKALSVMDFLLRNGSEDFVALAERATQAFIPLRQFKCLETSAKGSSVDHGSIVRRGVERVLKMLEDKNARKKARQHLPSKNRQPISRPNLLRRGSAPFVLQRASSFPAKRQAEPAAPFARTLSAPTERESPPATSVPEAESVMLRRVHRRASLGAVNLGTAGPLTAPACFPHTTTRDEPLGGMVSPVSPDYNTPPTLQCQPSDCGDSLLCGSPDSVGSPRSLPGRAAHKHYPGGSPDSPRSLPARKPSAHSGTPGVHQPSPALVLHTTPHSPDSPRSLPARRPSTHCGTPGVHEHTTPHSPDYPQEVSEHMPYSPGGRDGNDTTRAVDTDSGYANLLQRAALDTEQLSIC